MAGYRNINKEKSSKKRRNALQSAQPDSGGAQAAAQEGTQGGLFLSVRCQNIAAALLVGNRGEIYSTETMGPAVRKRGSRG